MAVVEVFIIFIMRDLDLDLYFPVHIISKSVMSMFTDIYLPKL